MPLTFEGEDLQKLEYLMRLGLMEVHTQSAMMMDYSGPDAPTRAENAAFQKLLVDFYTPIRKHMDDNKIRNWDE